VLLSGYRPFGRWAVRQADEVIAVSEWERDRLREDTGVEATVIPNGVNVERFAEAEPERRDRPYLLCVGRLEEYKGVQHVIRAMPELPEYDLVVAGTGPYRDELDWIASETGVRDCVDFLGYVKDDRLPKLYAGAEVYVTLSEFEAYGMTVAEALAAGTPCVVTDSGAIQQWNDHRNVTLSPTKPPEEVANNIKSGINSEGNTYTPATWDDCTLKILNIYDT
jgi:glycosyltransferase involved in cell wall biosynthesis